jgi:hypothetical protein
MKAVFKYILTIVLSAFLFIIGDISHKGEWTNKVFDLNYVLNYKIGTDNTTNNFLQVKVVNKANTALNDSIFNGLHIQLMTSDYALIANAKVKNGLAQINLSKVKFKNNSFILISPQTSNEIQIDCNSKLVEMEIDVEELKIYNRLNYHK